MAYGTFLRYHQYLDVYSRSVTTNSAGQKIGSWSLSESNVPCAFQPVSSERRVAPYIDNVEEYELLIPHTYASYFQYGYRVQDIKDRYNTTLIAGPFEVVDIARRTGWNGKLSHILVRIRLVVEVGS
jgi:hypothetical protein